MLAPANAVSATRGHIRYKKWHPHPFQPDNLSIFLWAYLISKIRLSTPLPKKSPDQVLFGRAKMNGEYLAIIHQFYLNSRGIF